MIAGSGNVVLCLGIVVALGFPVAAQQSRPDLVNPLGQPTTPSVSQDARPPECKRKTAGFFLSYSNDGAPKRLAMTLQSLPSSLTGASGDPERGREVFINRQKGDCLSCHKVSALPNNSEHGEVGPALDAVGARYSEGQLRQFVVNPKVYFPNTIMPAYVSPEKDQSVLTAAEVEDLVAYMKTLK